MTTWLHPQGRPANDLRKQAESRVPKTPTDVSAMSAADIERLVYELEVHQEELEIQNEELRRTQLALQRSRDRYVDLYDFAPVGYLTLDSNGTMVEANLTAATMLAVERGKLIGRRLALCCDQNSRENLRAFLDEILAGGKRMHCELNFTGKAEFWARLEGSCIAGADNESPHALVAMTDVTMQKQAQEDLRIRDRSFAAAANGILITDAKQPDNPVVYCNPAFEKITGYVRDEVLGHNCRFLQADDRDQPQRKEIRTAIENGREVHAVLRNYRKDGTLFWNELHIAPVRDESGELTHFVGIQNDITARKIIEEQDARRRIFEQRLVCLTPSERKVYELLIQGKGNKAIAIELDIGLRTVERRRHVILEKLQVESLADLLQQLVDIRRIGPKL